MIARAIAPTYAAGPARNASVRSAVDLAAYAAALPFTGGVELEFSEAGAERELPIPIPRLPALDEVEVERLSVRLASAAREEAVEVAGAPSSGSVTASCAAGAAAVSLLRVELEGLTADPGDGASYVLQGGETGTLSTVAFVRDDAGAATVVRLAQPGGLGPPAAAAPSFGMPGRGAAMYGPALGGASLALDPDPSGGVRAVLRLDPPLACARAAVLVGSADKESAGDGLPNDVAPVAWSARTVRAVFDVRPSGVAVEAATAATGDEHALVADFPSDPGSAAVAVELHAAARALLARAYPLAQGDDLGLKLVFRARSPGVLRAEVGETVARYVHRPLATGPARLELRGAPGSLDLAVAPGLKPAALSFTVGGTYGPARLTVDSDTAVPDLRHGLRVAGPVRVARRVALTAVEANLPLARVALLGRASEPCELLATLHRGDARRVGAPLGPPLSVVVQPGPDAAWVRAEWPLPGLLPPHPDALWLVARATRGAFWWHGALDADAATQRSGDDGETFGDVSGRPGLHVAVREVDPTTGDPAPLAPLSLGGPGGILNADLVGVEGGAVALPPQFQRFWVAAGAEHRTFLDGIAGAGGALRLTFGCARDVDLAISDAVLAYDPWRA